MAILSSMRTASSGPRAGLDWAAPTVRSGNAVQANEVLNHRAVDVAGARAGTVELVGVGLDRNDWRGQRRGPRFVPMSPAIASSSVPGRH